MIYKLRYNDKEAALIDLKLKGVIDYDYNYINGTEAVVECGIITLVYPAYDDKGNELKSAVFAEGYHYDVMSNDTIVFENRIYPKNARYKFSGENGSS